MYWNGSCADLVEMYYTAKRSLDDRDQTRRDEPAIAKTAKRTAAQQTKIRHSVSGMPGTASAENEVVRFWVATSERTYIWCNNEWIDRGSGISWISQNASTRKSEFWFHSLSCQRTLHFSMTQHEEFCGLVPNVGDDKCWYRKPESNLCAIKFATAEAAKAFQVAFDMSKTGLESMVIISRAKAQLADGRPLQAEEGLLRSCATKILETATPLSIQSDEAF